MFEEDLEELEDGFEEEKIDNSFEDELGEDFGSNRKSSLRKSIPDSTEGEY